MAVGEESAGRLNRRWLSWRRLLALIVIMIIVVAALVWGVIPYVQELSKYEQLTLRDYWWTRNSGGNISMFTLGFRNNGTKRLAISQVFVNRTKIDTTDWDCQKGDPRYDPKTQGRMYIAPRGMVFEEGAAYNITIGTESGEYYPYVITVLPGDVAEEKAVRIQYAIFWPSEYYTNYEEYIGVFLENNGTIPVIITEGWLNNTQYNINTTWVWTGLHVIPGISLGGGVMFQLNWNAGETYNFTLKTACGNTYNYTQVAGITY